jgi:hypothetical protein
MYGPAVQRATFLCQIPDSHLRRGNHFLNKASSKDGTPGHLLLLLGYLVLQTAGYGFQYPRGSDQLHLGQLINITWDTAWFFFPFVVCHTSGESDAEY